MQQSARKLNNFPQRKMSLTIFLIALAHGVPILLAKKYLKTKPSVILTTLAMCGVAIATGNFHYAIFDLIAIITICILCIRAINQPKNIKPEHLSKNPDTTPKHRKKNSDSRTGRLVALIAIIAFLYSKFSGTPPSEPTPTIQAPQPKTLPTPPSTSEQPKKSKKTTNTNLDESNKDLRRCLESKTNTEIIRCANQEK